MELEIVEKAWMFDNSNMAEPWFHNDESIYYGTKGQAKVQALPDNNEGKLAYTFEDLTFLNIKVKRAPIWDKVKYNEEVIPRFKVEEKKRLESLKNLPKDKYYYLQDRRSYVGNAVLWWGLNGSGYVTDLARAHKYSYEEISSFKSIRETDIVWHAEHVEKAVRQYVDSQGLNREYSI